jgi:hypothetical protein
MRAVRASRNIGGVLVHPPVLLDLAHREADGIVVEVPVRDRRRTA